MLIRPKAGRLRQTAKAGGAIGLLLSGVVVSAPAQTGAQVLVRATVLSVTPSADGRAAARRLIQEGKPGRTERGLATVQVVNEPQRPRRGPRVRVVVDYLRN
jgi:hypothetical protein